ncbi:Chorion protein S38 [Pseudolycoriella hygida]|uniref:Chorion protein S38 n=1 Tax=Pseudolycoriella hygida TaxID=35572 RepID=A0A9Q0RYC1_9DIPT|nr:Chorion protein S38 [Pseudolycoriella hygida]
MVQKSGLRVLIVLAVVHQSTMFDGGLAAYKNVQHSSYMDNLRLRSFAQRMQHLQTNKQSEIRETHVIKHPDEKIVHHPSKIYVKRPPTFVTINHPDIVIEPNPVVYHKPAAVIRSPVIYKHMPRKVQFRNIVKHIVKPIEHNVVLQRKQQSNIFPEKMFTSRPQYFSNASNYRQSLGRPTIRDYEQLEGVTHSRQRRMHSEDIAPSDISRMFFKPNVPSTLGHY